MHTFRWIKNVYCIEIFVHICQTRLPITRYHADADALSFPSAIYINGLIELRFYFTSHLLQNWSFWQLSVHIGTTSWIQFKWSDSDLCWVAFAIIAVATCSELLQFATVQKKRTFGDNRSRFLHSRCHICHPTYDIKTLDENLISSLCIIYFYLCLICDCLQVRRKGNRNCSVLSFLFIFVYL